ncbi:hypothetical protein BABINDRAFT_7150 [Babjeviella inositovora NRRL Y-12698]|uniref:UmuC domain-containing protein n=1 Tax=Babjeviella inositovora NRRL Y-12698 TaxID=984486 RepID=A0A1E3QWG4_9ASCO|nr:uncharacterized protein BABINDRAFT_7150 [Babjeviella inositovora NRRL Y-12698]ODQ81347.1 hypothetical protein BABINDRAFT_7150 [Babjeviella inositovora NRRL Y-12698]
MSTTAVSLGEFQRRLQSGGKSLPTAAVPAAFTYKNFHDLNNPRCLHLSPLSQIAHIDVNAFYAQVEQVRLGYTDKDPVVCVQWGSLIAVSYAARNFGIDRLDTFAQAKEKCPHIIGAHTAVYKKGEVEWSYAHEATGATGKHPSTATNKVALDPYRRESRKMMRIFKSLCDSVEKASMDEVYLDLGRLVYKRACELFPELTDGEGDEPLPEIPERLPEVLQWAGVVIPSFEEEGKDDRITENSDSTNISSTPGYGFDPKLAPEQLPLVSSPDHSTMKHTTNVAPLPISQASSPKPPSIAIRSWCDILLLVASQITLEIRTTIHFELGYTTSCGIAPCRTVSKLASAHTKPNNQTLIREGPPLHRFLDMYEMHDVTGFGGKIGKEVARVLGDPLGQVLSLTYIRDVYPTVEMVRKRLAITGLGDSAPKVYDLVRGQLRVPVPAASTNSATSVQTYLSSKNFRKPFQVRSLDDMLGWMKVFVADIVNRIRETDEEETTVEDMAIQAKRQRVARPRPTKITIRYLTEGGSASITRQATIPRILALEELREVAFDKGMDLLRQLELQWESLNTGRPMWPCINLGISLGSLKMGENEGIRLIDGFLKKLVIQEEIISTPEEKREALAYKSQKRLTSSVDIMQSLSMKHSLRQPMLVPSSKEERIVVPSSREGSASLEENPKYCDQCNSLVEEDMAEHLDYHFAMDVARQMDAEFEVEATQMEQSQADSKKRKKTIKGKKKVERGQSRLPF